MSEPSTQTPRKSSGRRVVQQNISPDRLESQTGQLLVPQNHSANATKTNEISPVAATSHTRHGLKKIVIKNLSDAADRPSDYDDIAWLMLEQAVLAIQQANAISETLEELYQAVENLCNRTQMANQIYDNLRALIARFVIANRQRFEELAADSDYLTYLRQLNDFWIRYSQQILLIRSIFMFLDRKVVQKHLTKTTIWDMGLDIFAETLLKESKVISGKLIDGILMEIDRERDGARIERNLMQSLLRMCIDVWTYESHFEKRFLDRTEQWYRDESLRLIERLTVPEYLRYVQRRLNEELERVEHYLFPSTHPLLMKICENQLIRNHVDEILEKGFDQLIDTNDIETLQLLYKLLAGVECGLLSISQRFADYIRRNGKELVIDPQKDKSMVKDLLDFKDKLDRITQISFVNNEKFVNVVKESFEYFINQRPNKPAELIAKYIDWKLKAGCKGASDQELEQLFDKIMVIFRFIHGKDVFEAFYKKDLAKRLLVGRSASVDAEKSMISKFKYECGSEFTSKLEGMFKDIELSNDFNATFKQQLSVYGSGAGSGGDSVAATATTSPPNIEFSVSILTMSFWPTYQISDMILPLEMSRLQESFTRFYLSKYASKKLQWQPFLGHCVLKANFASGQKILEVSQCQAVVLLLFNELSEMSYSIIRSSTNMDVKNLNRTLQSLACGKVRVLNKVPKGRDIDENDRFQFNNQFTNKYNRIKINQIQLKESNEEQRETEERAFQDRQYQIDAAIVRIMKTRRSLNHNNLISELFAILKFPTKATDLKKRIESLIDRDYMERDQDNTNQYNYIA